MDVHAHAAVRVVQRDSGLQIDTLVSDLAFVRARDVSVRDSSQETFQYRTARLTCRRVVECSAC